MEICIFPPIFKENTNILISPAETQGNPDIGYIWVFIDFSDSLDLLDEKKTYLPLPSVEQFILRYFHEIGLSG